MYIAIRLEGISFGNERILFKPTGVIKGEYDKELGLFIDEYGQNYNDMNGNEIYSNYFFCCPTDLSELIKIYNNTKTENEIMSEFLSEFSEICFVGYFDYVTGNIRCIELNFDEIAEEFANQEYDLDINESTDEKTIPKIENFLKDGIEISGNSLEAVENYVGMLIATNDSEKEKIDNNSTTPSIQEKPKLKVKLDKDGSKKFNLKEMRDFVLSEIVVQSEAVKRITSCFMTNINSTDCRRKKHLLLTGPKGVGKYKIIELICKYLDKPCSKMSSINYSQGNYCALTVNDMIQSLIYEAEGDIEKAQNGVLIIDELDEYAKTVDTKNILTKIIMDSLYEITNRGVIKIGYSDGEYETEIDFDTSNLTVIFTGDFESVEELDKQNRKKSLGFVKDNEIKKDIYTILFNCGMTEELIGNIQCIVPFKSLDNEAYKQILRYSKSSPLIIEKEYYESNLGIKFTFTSNYLKEISKQAIQLNIGIKGLQTVVSKSLEDIEERILNDEHFKVLKLTKSTALNNKNYYVKE